MREPPFSIKSLSCYALLFFHQFNKFVITSGEINSSIGTSNMLMIPYGLYYNIIMMN